MMCNNKWVTGKKTIFATTRMRPLTFSVGYSIALMSAIFYFFPQKLKLFARKNQMANWFDAKNSLLFYFFQALLSQ